MIDSLCIILQAVGIQSSIVTEKENGGGFMRNRTKTHIFFVNSDQGLHCTLSCAKYFNNLLEII